VNGYTKRHWIITLFILTLLTGAAVSRVYAQAIADREYFPETGHWVSGAFLEKYRSVPNPDALFGDPITDPFQDTLSGLTIQYFEKARFELHPQEIPDLRVKISNLGSFIYQKGQTLPGTFNPSACRFYPQVDSGYYICYDFLKFFDEKGGVAQFGYPISNFEIHNGWIAQYFQRARLEWHPENPLGEWVSVSNIGRQYFNQHNEDQDHLIPNRDENIPLQSTMEVIVRGFVATPVMPFSGTQTLYVIVQDQNRNPVKDAQVEFTITYPDGSSQTFQMNETDERGFSIENFQFTMGAQSPGIIKILIKGNYQELEGHTITSFQVWW